MTITVADLCYQLTELKSLSLHNWIITTSIIKDAKGEIKEIRLFASSPHSSPNNPREDLLYIFTPVTDWYPVTQE